MFNLWYKVCMLFFYASILFKLIESKQWIEEVDFFYIFFPSPFGKLSVLKNIHLCHLINSYSLTSKNAQS